MLGARAPRGSPDARAAASSPRRSGCSRRSRVQPLSWWQMPAMPPAMPPAPSMTRQVERLGVGRGSRGCRCRRGAACPARRSIRRARAPASSIMRRVVDGDDRRAEALDDPQRRARRGRSPGRATREVSSSGSRSSRRSILAGGDRVAVVVVAVGDGAEFVAVHDGSRGLRVTDELSTSKSDAAAPAQGAAGGPPTGRAGGQPRSRSSIRRTHGSSR